MLRVAMESFPSPVTDSLNRPANALGDRYRIERKLGAGGMATVYLARDLKHDREVAIKVLRSELAAAIGAELATIAWSFLSSGEPDDLARKQRAFFRRNWRIARMLVAKGFNKATMNDQSAVGLAGW